MAAIGTGISITFASGFLAEILETNAEFERPEIDTSHTGTTGARSSVPGNLIDGSLECEIAFAPETEPPWGDAAESVTITMPSAGTGGTSTWVFDGYLSRISWNAPLEERDTATVRIKATTLPVVTP